MERRSVNQTAALIFGAVYLLIGIVGFFVTKFDNFATYNTDKLFGVFEINPLHNIVHLVIGLFLLGAARGHRSARAANLTIGAAYALVFVLGLFLAPKTSSANFLALNQADNGLHIATAVILLAVALLADKAYTGRSTRAGGPAATRL
jgi:glucose uptake protein GlcU